MDRDARIRRADRADAEALAALRRAWDAEREPAAPAEDPPLAGRMADWLAREGDRRIVWVAEHGGAVIGMVNLVVVERMPSTRSAADRWGHVANAYVLPAHRGAGVGRALVAACTAHADAHRFARLVVHPTPRSVALYARAGFAPAASLLVRERPA